MNRTFRLFIISLIAMFGVDSALAQVNYLDRSWDDVISTDAKGQKADNHWYTLGGSRLGDRPTQKGIYIHGGKKAVIK